VNNAGSMWAVAQTTFRECWRRPFPLVLLLVLGGLALVSRLFQLFSFGGEREESVYLLLSSVFLAGFVHAAFVGTALVRRDLERGTLGLLLAQPLDRAQYLLGRYVGLTLAAAVLCGLVAALALGLLMLPIGGGDNEVAIFASLAGALRAFAPVLVLEAAALLCSAAASRVFAPILIVGLFVAGSLAGRSWLLPDFAVFGLEAEAGPPAGILLLYTGAYAVFFLLLGYAALCVRAPMRREG